MNISDLRLKAEALTQPGSFTPLSADEIMRLVYELQIHQHELEMQNDELRHVQQQLETSRQKYLDLYEHAPIAYFTFNKHGLILEVNLTGADLLRRERSRLVGKPFIAYLAEGTTLYFLRHLQLTIERAAPFYQADIVIRLSTPHELRQVQVESRAVFDEARGEMVIRSVLMDVTARYEAEMALQSQQALLRTVVESLPFDIFAIDEHGRYFLQNLTCQQHWGKNIIGKRPIDLCRDTDYEMLWLENNRRAFIGQTVVGEVEYTFGGQKQSVYNIITPMWVSGEIKGIVGINIDITERVKIEQTLRASEEKFRTLFELLPIGVSLLDKAGHLIDLNSTLAHMLQMSKEEAIRENYRNYIQLNGTPLLPDQIPGKRVAIEQQPIHNVQLGLKKRNLETIWVTVNAAPLPPQHGVGAVVVTNDVTNFKLTAERLQESQTRWQSVVDTMADGVIVMDGHGVIQSFNPAAEQIFGYSAAEAIGEYVNILMPEPARSQHQLYLAHYYQTKTAKVIGLGREVMGQRKDGSLFPLELAVNEFQVKGQPMFTGVVRDITARKKTEADLHEAHAQLAQAYDETLLGWALALELRDEGTSGHSLRVADLTVRLAQAMGMSQADLVHLRRGALLHDIGKMAIPDNILLKPGPLTLEERLVMQQHSVYAYQMLKPITYLAPALDIPHYHHELWDGSGYPEGLKGQEIPLAARIFAVVDVWDALTSDRPYRLAWPRDKALSHIYQRAGISFDPQVIEVFMQII